MRKSDVIKELREKRQKHCDDFFYFMKNEKFTQAVSENSGFGKNIPVFYKKVSDSIFLAFSIPTFKKIKEHGFHADFWKIIATSENEFLKYRIADEKLIYLRLSFDIIEDLDLYKNEILKY